MNREQFLKELQFKTSRSSGPGGQHGNKTASRVEVLFHIENSLALSELEKQRLLEKLAHRISKDGMVSTYSGQSRSQHRNKAIVIARLWALLEASLQVQKVRKKSRPSRQANEKRLRAKRNHSQKKAQRKPPKID